jgi:hypothetical protein
MSFRTLAPRLTVLDIPYFADSYSRTVRPIDLHNQSGMIQLYNTALIRSTNFPCSFISLAKLEVQIFPAQVYPLAELSKVLGHAVAYPLCRTFHPWGIEPKLLERDCIQHNQTPRPANLG